jgi:hypothetical protein
MRTLTSALTVAFCLMLLLTCGSRVLSAQPVSVLDAHVLSRELTAWFEAIATHVPGMPDASTEQVAAQSEDELRGVLRQVDALTRTLQQAASRNRPIPVRGTAPDGRLMPSRDTRELLGVSPEELADGDLRRVILRAVLLHTDTAVHLYEGEPNLLASARGVARTGGMMARDGHTLGMTTQWPHWDVARLLIARLVQQSPEAARDSEQWYVAVSSYMYAQSNLMDLMPHIRAALGLFPASPDVLFHAGLVHALMASPPLQAAARQASPPPGQKLDVVGAGVHLREARSLFTRALEAGGAHPETALRLGQVLLALGHPQDAAAVLEVAGRGPLDAPLEYCTELLLGNAYAAQEDMDGARRAYERAASLFPDAQSPWMALSRLARAEGHRTEALEHLQRVFERGRAVRRLDDPWWGYFHRDRSEPQRLLDAWRQAVVTGSDTQ